MCRCPFLHIDYNVSTRYKDIFYMQKSNLSGTCSALFLERGDKKLYNLICVGGRIARFVCMYICVWFFANVTDPFNIRILMLNKCLCVGNTATMKLIFKRVSFNNHNAKLY